MSNAAPITLRTAEPLSPVQATLARQHLEQILASRTFASSKRTQAFLSLVVSRALEGDIENLHERMIGAELFGRPISYDTGNDSVVRVRASELRKKLAQYYSSEARDRNLPVRIELRSGSYVPNFLFAAESAPAAGETTVQPFGSSLSPAAPNRVTAAAKVALQAPAAKVVSETPATPQTGRRWLGFARFALPSAAAGVLLALGAAHFYRSREAPAGSQAIRSIAVLPFDNLSGAPSQDFFADGLTEELINDLGQISTLRITSFTSSMSFKGTQKQLPEIARELGVDAVVEGGVLRDGTQVRISVQLIDARSDRPVWASSYVQDIGSVFAWQGQVSQSIAEEISTKVTPEEQARLARRSSVDAAAQDLYLHGLLLRNASGCGRAINYFRQAIARSPDYAEAHSALASCYGMLGESGQMPYEEAFTNQKAEASKALVLDDSLSEAHAELANTAMTLDWNWPTALAEFRRALQLNPSSATDHEKYAFYLVRTGQPQQAIAQIEQSVELDPVSNSTFHAEGFIYYFAHDYNQALAVAKTAQGLNINLPDWRFLLGAIYAAKGMYPQSTRAFLQAGEGPYALGHLGNVYARTGHTAAAKRTIQLLDNNVRKDGVGRYEIALVYAGLGDRNQAFQWLDDAYRAHDVGLVYLKVDPCLDPLRSDPRFALLLQRVGLAG
ncbi:MAG: TPR end-of-group domain-containing protein [Terracidiphilus sp.]